nr:hypothetical protein [Iocasia fonsfrigidae]
MKIKILFNVGVINNQILLNKKTNKFAEGINNKILKIVRNRVIYLFLKILKILIKYKSGISRFIKYNVMRPYFNVKIKVKAHSVGIGLKTNRKSSVSKILF